MLAPMLALFDISNSGFPHRFPRILLGAKPERAPIEASCVCYYMVGEARKAIEENKADKTIQCFVKQVNYIKRVSII